MPIAICAYLAADWRVSLALLLIPGTMRFPDGRRYASFSRILVSTWDSVVNGRINWGIPKDRANFDWVRGDGGALLLGELVEHVAEQEDHRLVGDHHDVAAGVVEAEVAAGALLVDMRPVEQRRRDGDLPGAIVIDRNVLEWRLDSASADRHPAVIGHAPRGIGQPFRPRRLRLARFRTDDRPDDRQNPARGIDVPGRRAEEEPRDLPIAGDHRHA